MNATALIATGGALAAGITAAFLLRQPGEPPASAQPSGPALAGPPPAAALKATPPPAPSATPAAEPEWKSADPPAQVARRLRESKDKRAFLDRALGVGGGAHLMIASDVVRRCDPVGEGGAVGAEQRFVADIRRDDPLYARRVEAFRGSLAGCDGFELRPVTNAERAAIERGLAQATDAAGRAHALLRGAYDAESSLRVARELVDGADPYLISLVSLFLMQQRLSAVRLAELDDRLVRAVNREQYAWLWATCDLGVDCGPLAQADCALRRLCDGGPPDEALRETKDQLVAAVRNRDWKRLGL